VTTSSTQSDLARRGSLMTFTIAIHGETMFRALRSLFKEEPPKMTLEQKLDSLAQFGFCLEAPFNSANLLESWSREAFEEPGFNLVLVGLGMTEEHPPWRNHCANVWHFDTECIEDDGAYVRIAQRMMEMAQGSLPITNLRDHVDVESEVAWLEFEVGGAKKHIDLVVKDDWVDASIFGHFVDLLENSDPTKIFLYHDLGGQDCIIACAAIEQYQQMRHAGLAFEPLKSSQIG
jgi:hypothetical protein